MICSADFRSKDSRNVHERHQYVRWVILNRLIGLSFFKGDGGITQHSAFRAKLPVHRPRGRQGQ